ncbi:lim and transglutaminase domain protein ltd-1-like isoform X1 [Mytilus galloprovincialis]|uniref:lim and transglutaminase domain protein ltd-1-like isoform X1 n=1 Tax=Mytilus galloprovincialis TaxID=29158 RepID=UPI003F7CBEB3
MGCAASMDGFPSKDSRRKRDLLETRNEKINEKLGKPERKYPRPRPPRDRKSHIYTPGGYSELEYNARRADFNICLTWHSFVKYLTQAMTTDIEKVRSLFVWMGCQNFQSGSIPNGKEDSPLSYMSKVKKKTMSYAAFFVKICRAAGLKSVLIKGIAKSVVYDVGDPLEELQQLRNNWCAIHVNGDWRFVFPLWAYSAVEGRITDKYTLIEGGKMSRSKASPGSAVKKFNEFFFLTDPDVFIHFAIPDNPDWQLLTVPLTLDRYLEEPYFRQPYFENKLQVATLLPGVQKAKHGIVEIGMKSLIENWQGLLTYQLFFNNKKSTEVLPKKTQLSNFVLMDRCNSNWKFTVRFPIDGVYKLTINGGVPPKSNEWVCDFKLVCKTAIEDIPPLPCDTGAVGWGPSNNLQQYGLTAPSHTHGTILTKLRQYLYIGFTLTKKLFIRSELIGNKYKSSELDQYVDQRITNRELVVKVMVPEDGEFALRMYARETKKLPEENVINYLITTDDPAGPRTYRKENAFEKNLRKELVTLTQQTKDPDEMDKAIERFDKLALEDKGDLKKAKSRRDFLKIRKDLTDATVRRHYGTLDTAIKKARESKYEAKLKNTTKKAEEVRNEVYSTWIHEILEMKPSTVAELKTYKNPPSAIFDTMKAVYLLLGESADMIKTWEDIHSVLSTIGNDSLLQRIKTFQTSQLREHALEEAQKLTEQHDLPSIKSKSPAAGTFYVWVRDLVNMINDERSNPKRKKKRKEISTFSAKTTSTKKSQ